MRLFPRVRVQSGAGDAGTFWTAVVDALSDSGLPLPDLPESRSIRGLAERMLTTAGRLTLVIDSFENVTSPGLDQELVETLSAATDLRLVVATRNRHHFPDEVTGRISTASIRARDLLLTDEETANLFSVCGLSPSAYRSDTLQRETGGWPELVHAVVAKLGDTPADPQELSGIAVGTAIDYLRRRLLSDATCGDRLEFAMISSLPEDFTISLAESIGGADASRHIRWLEEQGLLLTVAGRHENVHRWPDAARAALQEELSACYPDRLAEFHARAAGWSLTHGRPARALSHALEAGEWPLVVEVLENAWRFLPFAEPTLLHRTFATVPPGAMASSPRVAALRELLSPPPSTRLLELGALPRSAAQLIQLGMSGRARETLDTGILISLALRRRGDFEVAADYADRLRAVAAAARPTDTACLRPEVELNAGLSMMLTGNHGGAEQSLRAAYESEDADAPRTRSAAAALLALNHAVVGEVDLARHWLDRCEGPALAPGPWTGLGRTAVAVARLLTALDRMDCHAAEAAARALWSPRPRSNELWAFVLYAQAQYALHLGDPIGTLDRLQREQTAHRQLLGPDAVGGPLLTTAQAALLLSAGHADQAGQLLRRAAPHPLLRVPAARLELLRDDPGAVRQLAADQVWERSANPRDRLEMTLLRAIARHRGGDRAGAIAAVRQAGEIATAVGLVRPFSTVPRAELAAVAHEVPTVTAYLAATAGRREPYPCSVAIVQLTDREHRVLRQLADGSTLAQTAGQLVVSYNTVKTHVRNIYRKLEASSREDAVARARQLGLLDPPAPPSPPHPEPPVMAPPARRGSRPAVGVRT